MFWRAHMLKHLVSEGKLSKSCILYIAIYSYLRSELWQAISEDILNPPADLVNDYNASVRWTSRVEASRRSAMEQANIAIRTVADLETRLMLKHPWVEDTPEYQDTVKYMQQRTFHRTLNKLEQLVVQRLFELSKANVVGMGKLLTLSSLVDRLIIFHN